MAYKIKNGAVWIQHDGKWWLDSVLFMCYPELKAKGLVKEGS